MRVFSRAPIGMIIVYFSISKSNKFKQHIFYDVHCSKDTIENKSTVNAIKIKKKKWF